MAFEHPNGKGTIFNNKERKRSDSAPDWYGNVKHNDIDYELKAWEIELPLDNDNVNVNSVYLSFQLIPSVADAFANDDGATFEELEEFDSNDGYKLLRNTGVMFANPNRISETSSHMMGELNFSGTIERVFGFEKIARSGNPFLSLFIPSQYRNKDEQHRQAEQEYVRTQIDNLNQKAQKRIEEENFQNEQLKLKTDDELQKDLEEFDPFGDTTTLRVSNHQTNEHDDIVEFDNSDDYKYSDSKEQSILISKINSNLNINKQNKNQDNEAKNIPLSTLAKDVHEKTINMNPFEFNPEIIGASISLEKHKNENEIVVMPPIPVIEREILPTPKEEFTLDELVNQNLVKENVSEYVSNLTESNNSIDELNNLLEQLNDYSNH